MTRLDRDQRRAVMRSLRIYHGARARKARMDALYARFVAAGDLVFDIGAHVGDRVSSFRRLGARVVAVEPQPGPARAIAIIHGRDPHVTLLRAAVSDREGRIALRVNSRNPTVSTVSEAFVAAAEGARGWEGQAWDQRIEVDATTLDAMIRRFGAPAFVKIDVEGAEDLVVAGLHHRVPALSFEFTTIARDVAARALDRLAAFGSYRFGFALGESQDLVVPGARDPARGLSAQDMGAYLDALPHEANSGDVYAWIAA